MPFLFSSVNLPPIDKNSIWGGLKIQKRQLCVKGILEQGILEQYFRTRSWVCFGSFSAGIRGVFGVEVERGRIQRFAEVRQAFLRLIRTHRFLPPSIPDLYD
jgi:hypothetical protein